MSNRALGQSTDSGDDSDIEEIAVILPKNFNPDDRSEQRDGHYSRQMSGSPVAKRRKSSPQMDPIPTYSPTPLHILEQRGRSSATSGLDHSHIAYSPTPLNNQRRSSPYSSITNEYVPLLQPSPSVVGRQTSTSSIIASPQSDVGRPTSAVTPAQAKARRTGPSSSSTPRPVSSALAQAVAKRRKSQQGNVLSKSAAAKAICHSIQQDVSSTPESLAYAEEPILWSPQLPSQIEPVKNELVEKERVDKMKNDEEYEKYRSPRAPKQRVAHKPTIPKNRQNRPKMPLGTSKKIPLALRVKYLEVISNEYLNTGHEEDESYQNALKEEQALANRAANKNIYVNLVAGLKKKIREQAGISTKPPDDDPRYVNGNKVVSHSEILTGKVIGTFSIERKRKLSDPSELNEHDLYDRLSRYLVPVEELEAYGYPCRDPDNPNLRKVPLGKDGQKQQLRAQLASSYTCERCTKVYRVGEDGMPLSTTGKCIFHPGHLWNERINRAIEKRYSCCKGDQSAGGCSSNPFHVHKGEFELENYKGYVETQPKPERDPNKHGIYALDCEMCHTTHGLELTRITVINYKYDVVYEKLVRPKNPILDYNTKFSGIKQGDLDNVNTTLADVQRDLLEMFSSKTILVGHSLDSDMKALKIFHKRFIDTAQLFPHKRGLPFKRALRTLMVENLRVIIQEDVGHDSKEDASAAFRLVMWKAKTDVPAKV